MGKLPKQFKDALSRIEVRGEKLDRAIAAHSEIRGYLEEDEQLRRWGVDTVLIASYARRTGIYPCRFERLRFGYTPVPLARAVK